MPFSVFPYGYFYKYIVGGRGSGSFDVSFLYDSDLFQLVDSDGFDLDASEV